MDARSLEGVTLVAGFVGHLAPPQDHVQLGEQVLVAARRVVGRIQPLQPDDRCDPCSLHVAFNHRRIVSMRKVSSHSRIRRTWATEVAVLTGEMLLFAGSFLTPPLDVQSPNDDVNREEVQTQSAWLNAREEPPDVDLGSLFWHETTFDVPRRRRGSAGFFRGKRCPGGLPLPAERPQTP